MGYRGVEQGFEDFIEYNDVGLPLAHFIAEGLVDSNPKAEAFVDETFNLLLASLNINDTGFDSLSQMLA
jgi:hypothetical protein